MSATARSPRWFVRTVVAGLAGSAAVVAACKSPPKPAPGVAPTSDAGGAAALPEVPGLPAVVRQVEDAGRLAAGIPVPQAAVDAEVNPEHLAPYAGPTGAVEGIVRMHGDPPPKAEVTIPFECGDAYGTYGTVFREGPGRTVADVLVAVTGYRAYLPPEGEAVPVTISGCAYDRRTVGMMFGQHIEVANTDSRLSFVPTLLGAEMPAELVALPRGDAIRLYPRAVGHYALADGMNRTWMYADVFVVRYRTHAVTPADGTFHIARVPVGKAKLSAYLPAIDASLHPEVGVDTSAVEQEIEIVAGQTAHVELALSYKRPKAKPKPPRQVVPRPEIH